MTVRLDCGVSVEVVGWQCRSCYELVGGGFTTQADLKSIHAEIIDLAGQVKFDSMSFEHPYYFQNEKAYVIPPNYVELSDPSQHPVLKHRWHPPTQERLLRLRERLSECGEEGRDHITSEIEQLEKQLSRKMYSVLPLEMWAVELDCEEPVHPGWDGSMLIAAWFQEPQHDASLNLIIGSAIRAIPWNDVASDYEALP